MKVQVKPIAWGLLLGALLACNRATPTSAPLSQPETSAAVPTAHPGLISMTVYFTDTARYEAGAPPFEAPVTRLVEPGVSLPEAALVEFFRGPTPEERANGLELIASGFTGFSGLSIEDGIARVYLTGPCSSNGATYTIAAPLLANLIQFPGIQSVKIYDAEGTTEIPNGPGNSIPFCLEP